MCCVPVLQNAALRRCKSLSARSSHERASGLRSTRSMHDRQNLSWPCKDAVRIALNRQCKILHAPTACMLLQVPSLRAKFAQVARALFDCT